jgi:hypothetical protein
MKPDSLFCSGVPRTTDKDARTERKKERRKTDMDGVKTGRIYGGSEGGGRERGEREKEG